MPLRTARLLTLTFVAAASLLGGGNSREIRRTLPLAPGGSITVDTDRATVRITPWDKAEVDVYAKIQARREAKDPEESIKRVNVQVEQSGGGVRIVTRANEPKLYFKDDGNMYPKVEINIQVPRNVALTMQQDRSVVELGELTGTLKLNLDRTQVKMAGFRGQLEVVADRGQIVAGNLALSGDGRIHLDRSEANLELAQGLNLDAEVDRGELRLERSLSPAETRREGRKVIFHGAVAGGGPRLTVVGDRSWLRLRQ